MSAKKRLADSEQEGKLLALVMSGIAAGAVILLAAHFVGRTAESSTFDLTAEWAKALFTLASLVLSAVVIGTIVNRWQTVRDREHQIQLDRLAAVDDLRAKIRLVHAELKGAAIRIRAHQSVKTYGEEARRLMDVVVMISDIQWVIANDASFAVIKTQVPCELDKTHTFVSAVISEFENEFLAASRYQSWFEEWLRRQKVEAFKNAATLSNPPEVPNITESVSSYLLGTRFPELRRLILIDEDDYKNAVSEPLKKSIGFLGAFRESIAHGPY